MHKIVQISEMNSEELLSNLRTIFKETINEARIADFVEEEILLTRKEVCQLLKIDASTLHRWCLKGIVSSYGVSNRIYFLKTELLEAVKKNKIHFYPELSA